MEKPIRLYRPGTILYRLLEQDWSEKNISQIAKEMGANLHSIQCAMYKIKKKTGYQVPYKHLPAGPVQEAGCLPDTIRQYQKQKPKIPHTCAYCANTACQTKWRAVCWTRCPGFVQRRKETECESESSTQIPTTSPTSH